MPIYEYQCQKCGKIFETYMRLSDKDEDLKCPVCGAEKPVKKVSAFSSCGNTGSSSTGSFSGSSCGGGRSGFG